jgi:hypothetical protein
VSDDELQGQWIVIAANDAILATDVTGLKASDTAATF